jgi:hypothetical protein
VPLSPRKTVARYSYMVLGRAVHDYYDIARGSKRAGNFFVLKRAFYVMSLLCVTNNNLKTTCDTLF